MWRGGYSSLSFGFIAIPILSPACPFFQTRAVGDNRRTCNFQCHDQKREGNVEGNKEIDGWQQQTAANVFSLTAPFYWFALSSDMNCA